MNGKPNFLMEGAEGEGEYGLHHAQQSAADILYRKDKMLQLIDGIPARVPGDVFTIGDFGAADGSASIPLIRAIIGQVRERQPKLPVQVVYEDQATSDWNSLFKRIHGVIQEPRSYMEDFDNVYVSGSGTSFHRQVVPPNSADFICSFIAAQYLSKSGIKYKDSFHRYPYATPEEREIVGKQAATDWENFLVLRAKELKSGGVLVVNTTGDHPKSLAGGPRPANYEKDLPDMWRKFRDEGKITQEEYEGINLDRVRRYLEEVKAPFEQADSPVKRAGLVLLDAELTLSPCILTQQWKEKKEKEGVSDRRGLAKAIIGEFRCWTKPQLMRVLSSNRSDKEKATILDELYKRMEEDIVSADPNVYSNDSLHVWIFARKQ